MDVDFLMASEADHEPTVQNQNTAADDGESPVSCGTTTSLSLFIVDLWPENDDLREKRSRRPLSLSNPGDDEDAAISLIPARMLHSLSNPDDDDDKRLKTMMKRILQVLRG